MAVILARRICVVGACAAILLSLWCRGSIYATALTVAGRGWTSGKSPLLRATGKAKTPAHESWWGLAASRAETRSESKREEKETVNERRTGASASQAAVLQELLDFYGEKAPAEEPWPVGRTMRVRGVSVFYKDSDPGGRQSRDKPTIVLIHGFAASTASFDEVMQPLSKAARVIAFDRPGFGRTERVMPNGSLPWQLSARTLGENPYTAKFCAKLMWGMLDRLGVEDVTLVSHSLGAQVALRASLLRPNSVRAMVLTAPAILNPLDSRFSMGKPDNGLSFFAPILNLRPRLEMVGKIMAFNVAVAGPTETALEAVRDSMLGEDIDQKVKNNFHNPDLVEKRPQLITKYITPLKEENWDMGLLQFYRATAQETTGPGEQLMGNVMASWRGAMMVVAGENDALVPLSACTYIAEEFGARLVVVEQCGHIPMDEKAEVFAKSVVQFIRSTAVRSGMGKGGRLPWLKRRR
ncbi:unnamed protein product [Chrysoparadoxa australica]